MPVADYDRLDRIEAQGKSGARSSVVKGLFQKMGRGEMQRLNLRVAQRVHPPWLQRLLGYVGGKDLIEEGIIGQKTFLPQAGRAQDREHFVRRTVGCVELFLPGCRLSEPEGALGDPQRHCARDDPAGAPPENSCRTRLTPTPVADVAQKDGEKGAHEE